MVFRNYWDVLAVLPSNRYLRRTARRVLLREWLETVVLPVFLGRVLAIDAIVAQRCARLHVPDPRSERDALIAASAMIHGMTVVTRNVCDFESMGVALLNPWDGPG